MNDQQRLYFDQAKSDYEVFQFLVKRPACHRLHYLQMCTEKLGKAYFYGTSIPPKRSHKSFVKFLRNLPAKPNVWKALGFGRRHDLVLFIQKNHDLIRQVEDLAPQLADEGPNPEYPWPPPPKLPVQAPIHYDFSVWKHLQRSGRGLIFQNFLSRLLEIFPDWF